MKKILFITAIVIGMIGCNQQTKEEGYTINGTLKGNVENSEVKLFSAVNQEEEAIDSTVIREGKFQLKGKIDEPGMYQLLIVLPDTSLSPYDKKLGCRFYLENSDITFEADAATMQSFYYYPGRTGIPVITGSATEDLHNKLKKEQGDIRKKIVELDNKIMNEYRIPSLEGKEVDVEAAIRYQTETETLLEQKDKITMAFVKENPSSPITLDQVLYWLYENNKNSAQWDEIMAVLEPHWTGNTRFEDMKKEVTDNKRIAIGEKFPDAEFLNEKGEKLLISSVIPQGKYTLVEFWASWCGPCRGEIPHLKKIKKKYPEFEIINVSIDEEDAAWRKALSEEKMPWLQLNNPDGFKGSAQDIYRISGIPAGFILNQEGKIVKSDARGINLDKFLFETYGR